ncbi:MAG TPA: DUF5658 family protein [Blastocatellia bacterium]|jgi:hypothetical protein|nr:DUF5658 family protein [Blastocatellia bacterium]
MVRTGELFQDPKSFVYMVAAIVMSGYDAVATMWHISRGVAVEGNPLLEPLIEQNAIIFFLVKMLITAACLLICYRFSHVRMARLGIRLVVALYLIISIYHFGIIIHA